jgi:hypothetical protein
VLQLCYKVLQEICKEAEGDATMLQGIASMLQVCCRTCTKVLNLLQNCNEININFDQDSHFYYIYQMHILERGSL